MTMKVFEVFEYSLTLPLSLSLCISLCLSFPVSLAPYSFTYPLMEL